MDGLIPPVDPARLRETIERAVRDHMREIAPGLENSAMVNIAIDGIVQEHIRLDATIRAIDYAAPAAPAPRSPAASSDWRVFRANWAAEFQGTFSAPAQDSGAAQESVMGPLADRVDALRMAYETNMGVDWGMGRDRTAWTMFRRRASEAAAAAGENVIVDPPYGMATRDRDPWAMVASGGIRRGELFVHHAPTSPARDAFTYSTLRSILNQGRFHPQPRHPFIQAVLRTKMYRGPAPKCPPLEEPKYGRLSVWERLLRNPYSGGRDGAW